MIPTPNQLERASPPPPPPPPSIDRLGRRHRETWLSSLLSDREGARHELFLETGLSVPIIIMDGGMGTTLEDVFEQDISNTPLWSARVIQDSPQVLQDAHLAFLRAGSHVFQTATYQCAHETFARAGYGDDDAKECMRRAVQIADDARHSFLSESAEGQQQQHDSTGVLRPRPALCLSLGPYGAVVPGAQEFTGLYPPPFGPSAPDDPSSTRSTAFAMTREQASSPTVDSSEAQAEDALADFHLRRLLVFADDPDTWSLIDVIAFETVPLLREARAIRRAVVRLEKEMGMRSSAGAVEQGQMRMQEWAMKPWFIAFNFPDGRCLQERWKDGPRIDVGALVNDVFSPSSFNTDSSPSASSRPMGIGINCTAPRHLPQLIKEMTEAMRDLPRPVPPPCLVVYPNGGAVYDGMTQKWSDLATDAQGNVRWATNILGLVQEGLQSAVTGDDFPWSGVVLGGCCKVAPADISALDQLLKESYRRESEA